MGEFREIHDEAMLTRCRMCGAEGYPFCPKCADSVIELLRIIVEWINEAREGEPRA